MPRSFRGYEVGQKIGSGGMSTLYKGVQTALGRTVAIKLLHPGLADDESFIARFEREARAASALGHPNIVAVIDFGSEDDVYYIVMEYVPGTDLRVVLNKTPKIPPEVVLAMLEEVAYGLEAAHERGIVHRDIKPGNILLSTSGQVKIADFGLARQSSDIERISALTVPGSVLGTPAYMSPEQAAGKDVDHRTDIYALGVMAYELFTGEKPFQGGTYSEIRDQIINRDPPPISMKAAVTEEIEALVSRMIEKDPDRRFPSAKNLVRAIEDCMETLDPSGGLIKHRRKYLGRFAQDPGGFGEELRRSSVSAHLDRGFYYQKMGLSKMDDAVREFRYVLFIDPENSKAQSALEDLQKTADESGVRLPANPGPPRGGLAETGAATGEEPRPSLGSIPSSGVPASTEDAREATRVLSAEQAQHGVDATQVGTAKGKKDRKFEISSTGSATAPVKAGAKPGPRETAPPTAPRAPFDLGKYLRPAGIGLAVLALAFIVFRMIGGGSGSGGDTKKIATAGAIRIETEPAGAAVTVRGPGEVQFRETGLATNCVVPDLSAGEWDVRVVLAGFKPTVRRVPVQNAEEKIVLRLEALEGANLPSTATAAADSSAASSAAPPPTPTPPETGIVPSVPPVGTTGTGRLAITTQPAGAKISLRGPGEKSFRALANVSPLTTDPIPAGSWDVRAELAGFVRSSGRAEVARDAVAALTLNLEKEVDAGPGWIEVVAVPFADVYVDGKLVQSQAKRVVAQVTSPPGKKHVVELRHPTFGSHKFERVAVAAGDTTNLGRYDFKMGKISVFCKPAVPADVFIDGAKADRQTPFAGKFNAAKHRVGIVKEGFIVKEVLIIDAGGGEKRLTPKGSRNEVDVTVPGDGEVKVQFIVEKKG